MAAADRLEKCVYGRWQLCVGEAPVARTHRTSPLWRPGVSALPSVPPVKPIDSFCARWDRIVTRVLTLPPQGRVRVLVVGGGAGGVELALAMCERLRRDIARVGCDPRHVTIALVSRSRQLMPQHSAGVRRCFERLLAERGVELHLGVEVREHLLRCIPGVSNLVLLCLFCALSVPDASSRPVDRSPWTVSSLLAMPTAAAPRVRRATGGQCAARGAPVL